MTLKPSIYLLFVPVYLTLAVIACTGQLVNMQIRDEPVYVCPTSTPRPTHTPRPTDTQPDIHVPPSGWATHTPEPGCYWNGVACVPYLPAPGGIYTEPGYTLPGAHQHTPSDTHALPHANTLCHPSAAGLLRGRRGAHRRLGVGRQRALSADGHCHASGGTGR